MPKTKTKGWVRWCKYCQDWAEVGSPSAVVCLKHSKSHDKLLKKRRMEKQTRTSLQGGVIPSS
jgi:hypothetical protein